MRAILVDDEPLARERLRSMLAEASVDIDIVGEAENGRRAVPLIHELKPDLVFLDIQMPGLDGFDVLDLLAPPRPHIIFVTAYDAYALRAFEVHALDYLTKPVTQERLETALRHFANHMALHEASDGIDALRAERAAAEPLKRLTLHAGRRLRIVEPAEVRYFEADEKVVFAHLAVGGKHITDFTLQELEDRLDPDGWMRIHRAYLINIEAIRELTPWFSGTYQLTLDDKTVLPVARRRARDVKTMLRGA